MAKPVLLTVDDDPDVLKAIERDLRSQYVRTIAWSAAIHRKARWTC
jgi:hypothetical protein